MSSRNNPQHDSFFSAFYNAKIKTSDPFQPFGNYFRCELCPVRCLFRQGNHRIICKTERTFAADYLFRCRKNDNFAGTIRNFL